VSWFALEQHASRRTAVAGDADPHLAACDLCRARLRELDEHRERFRSEIDVESALDALMQATRARTRSRAWSRPWGVAAATALAIAACVVLWLRPRSDDSHDQVTRKGGLYFKVIRLDRAGHVGPVASGDHLHPGEAIRFRLTAREPGFVSIIGVDAARTVTAYSGPLALERGVARVVDGSIILDDTLGPERIIAVECGSVVSTSTLIELAQRELAAHAGDPRQVDLLLSSCSEASILIEKEP
jgi:hypothetical protein